jgi:hypothetical protein
LVLSLLRVVVLVAQTLAQTTLAMVVVVVGIISLTVAPFLIRGLMDLQGPRFTAGVVVLRQPLRASMVVTASVIPFRLVRLRTMVAAVVDAAVRRVVLVERVAAALEL